MSNNDLKSLLSQAGLGALGQGLGGMSHAQSQQAINCGLAGYNRRKSERRYNEMMARQAFLEPAPPPIPVKPKPKNFLEEMRQWCNEWLADL